MSKILITGNGFDLFHHLPTKYGHFMSIMKTIEKNKYHNEVSFDELFGHDFRESFESDYDLIVENYKVENIKFDYLKIKELGELLRNNNWYKYFDKVRKIETWIDFESEIGNVLNQMSSLIRLVEMKRSRTTIFNNHDMNIYIDFSEFDFCNEGIVDGISINDKYINSRTGKFDAKRTLNELGILLNSFTIIFNMYLSHIVMQFYDNYNNTLRIPINLIDFFYSFNYTPTLESIYNKNIDVVYLHGKTNSDISLQNIVLGVDEIPNEIVSLNAFEFSKYYQKIIKKTNNNLLSIPDESTHITEEHVFYIFGHSLDKSDKEYIKHIFDFLKNDNTEASNVRIFYYDQKDNINKLKNLLSFMKKEVIIDFHASGRLDFVEISESNIEREFSKTIWKKYDEGYIM